MLPLFPTSPALGEGDGWLQSKQAYTDNQNTEFLEFWTRSYWELGSQTQVNRAGDIFQVREGLAVLR